MFTICRTTAADQKFQALVSKLDADLAMRDGTEHAFYDQFNSIAQIKYAVLAMENNEAVGCGAIKLIEPGIFEVKRMFTSPAQRGKGIAALVLQELERWAIELGGDKCMLETGKMQPEAIALYKKCGYKIIPNYGQYAGVENSICFEKPLHHQPS